MKFMQMHHTKWEKNALLGYKCPVSESMFLEDVLHMHTQVQAHTHTQTQTHVRYILSLSLVKKRFSKSHIGILCYSG